MPRNIGEPESPAPPAEPNTIRLAGCHPAPQFGSSIFHDIGSSESRRGTQVDFPDGEFDNARPEEVQACRYEWSGARGYGRGSAGAGVGREEQGGAVDAEARDYAVAEGWGQL